RTALHQRQHRPQASGSLLHHLADQAARAFVGDFARIELVIEDIERAVVAGFAFADAEECAAQGRAILEAAGEAGGRIIPLATVNPARAARIEGRQKGLETGERGDVVRLRYLPETHQVYIEETWLGGEQVYSGTMTPD
ncbi:MAG TPA: hypothetical protein PLK67_02070, partial [Bryobacteraceae bacterium]|nr:hypothetical protein [Bryobacteraceae bacterium]